MPFRLRKSIRLGKRARLNLSRRGVSTSVRLPGGITWTTGGSRSRKKAQPRGGTVKKKGLSSKTWKGIGIFLGVVVLIEVVGAALFGGDPEEVSVDPSEDAGIERVITVEEPAPLVLYEDSEPEPEPVPAAEPEPETVPEIIPETIPEPEPAAEPTISLYALTSPIGVNETATISIIGTPWTDYKIAVMYSGGYSSAKGLEKTTANENGWASWSWKIGGNVAPGDYKITITGGGETFETWFTVAQ